MNTNTDELLNQHYARLLGLGEEWEVTRVELNLSAKRLDIYLDYAARAAVCPRCGALAGELIEKALTPRQREMVCGVAIDMSAPYAKAIGEKLPDADIVYDRFHVQKQLNEAVDAVRRQENARLLKAKDRRLAKTKYLWLAGLEHLSDEAVARREDLLRMSLSTGKAWGLKEMFSCFWRSRDKDFAAANFDFWHAQVLRSGLRSMIKAAATLKRHLGGLLAWFDCRIDNAMSEGYNSVIQALKSAARGFRNFENYRIAILFHSGKLDMQPDLVRVGSSLPT